MMHILFIALCDIFNPYFTDVVHLIDIKNLRRTYELYYVNQDSAHRAVRDAIIHTSPRMTSNDVRRRRLTLDVATTTGLLN
jgi:hypothetical protein